MFCLPGLFKDTVLFIRSELREKNATGLMREVGQKQNVMPGQAWLKLSAEKAGPYSKEPMNSDSNNCASVGNVVLQQLDKWCVQIRL